MARLIQVIEVEDEERIAFTHRDEFNVRHGKPGTASWTKVQPVKRYYTADGELLFTADTSMVMISRAELDAMQNDHVGQAMEFQTLKDDYERLTRELGQVKALRNELGFFAIQAHAYITTRARGRGPWRIRQDAKRLLEKCYSAYREGIKGVVPRGT